MKIFLQVHVRDAENTAMTINAHCRDWAPHYGNGIGVCSICFLLQKPPDFRTGQKQRSAQAAPLPPEAPPTGLAATRGAGTLPSLHSTASSRGRKQSPFWLPGVPGVNVSRELVLQSCVPAALSSSAHSNRSSTGTLGFVYECTDPTLVRVLRRASPHKQMQMFFS